jgi:hypothetical protein
MERRKNQTCHGYDDDEFDKIISISPNIDAARSLSAIYQQQQQNHKNKQKTRLTFIPNTIKPMSRVEGFEPSSSSSCSSASSSPPVAGERGLLSQLFAKERRQRATMEQLAALLPALFPLRTGRGPRRGS